MSTALFCVVTQKVMVTPYRRFATIFLKGQDFLTFQNWTDRLSRNVGKKIITTRCVMTQKSAVLFPSKIFYPTFQNKEDGLISIRVFRINLYIRRVFGNYVQKSLSNCRVELCASWWMASEPEICSS